MTNTRTSDLVAFSAIVIFTLLVGNDVVASEPFTQEITIKCVGNSKTQQHAPLVHGIDRFETRAFDVTIQFRDRIAIDVSTGDNLGESCFLDDNKLGCSYDYVTGRDKGIQERRQGLLILDRLTGSLQMLHSEWFFEGDELTPSSLLTFNKLQRDGICERVTVKPVF